MFCDVTDSARHNGSAFDICMIAVNAIAECVIAVGWVYNPLVRATKILSL